MRKIKGLILALAVVLTGSGVAMAQTEEEQIAAIVAAMPYQPGTDAPDFTLKNAAGQDVSLSEFKGKWVILDFWGSWCRFCIAGIPEMKDTYEKYHDKGLEIIGIDCNEPQEPWLAALEKYQLPWINVYNPAPRDEGVGALYGVKAYPTKILINPEGKIDTICLGEDPDFYALLQQIFQQ